MRYNVFVIFILFFISCTKIYDIEERNIIIDGVIYDVDGNSYKVDTIGNQVWMLENLKTTHYSDRTPINYPGKDNHVWASDKEGSYAYLNNDSDNSDRFGALYNWYAVNTNKLCPEGFHVPSDEEWGVLEMFLGLTEEEVSSLGWRGTHNEGGRLKGFDYWNEYNVTATDEFGFNVLPGELRYYNGQFTPLLYQELQGASFWTTSTMTTFEEIEYGILRSFNANHGSIVKWRHGKENGYSVRCVKDEK